MHLRKGRENTNGTNQGKDSSTFEKVPFYLPLTEKRLYDDYLFYTVIHGERHQMSDDTVAKFMAKYGVMAKEKCISVSKKVHPHLFRHARAIHLYRSGIPLPLLSEFMGHADVQTTTIYAYADTEMKRQAIENATNNSVIPKVNNDIPTWKNDE